MLYAVLNACYTWYILNLVYTILGVFLYLIYAVVSVDRWSVHNEIASDDFTSYSKGMVELRTRMREMPGDRRNHDETLRRRGMLCASQFTISNMARRDSDPVCNSTNMWASKPNQASNTPEFSYPFLSSTSFSFSSPIALSLVHNSTMFADHKTKSSLSLCQCHD
jgi:hypothetical protein